jgi:hypothetical protein
LEKIPGEQKKKIENITRISFAYLGHHAVYLGQKLPHGMLVIITSPMRHLVSINEHQATIALSLAVTAFVSTFVQLQPMKRTRQGTLDQFLHH